ncbi:hypothetical protein HOI83_02035 [Candidatus Uhrbacteria bacterium]|mgnify:CR=1 FL=1|jgi:diacylglycerol kinase family enzyme|nr:hypothetical protein [Candidatus Uhrbacteria bacterium]
MYCYVYDDFVQEKKYERELDAIENRITDLGLQGKTIRLALFRNADETIRDEVKRGIKTVVAVGNDATVHKVLNAVIDSGAVLALIPVGEPTVLAHILGVPGGVKACDVLSQRIIEKMDAGMVNHHRFITGVSIPGANAKVSVGGRYDVTPLVKGGIEVRNLSVKEPRDPSDISDPTDGKLDLVIETEIRKGFRKKIGVTKLPLPSFNISYKKNIKATADGAEIEGQEFSFSVERKVLQAVVGRERMF